MDLSMVIISTGTQVPLQSGRSLTASGQVVDVTAWPLWQPFITTNWTFGIDTRFTTTSELTLQIPDIHAIQLFIPSHPFTHQRHPHSTTMSCQSLCQVVNCLWWNISIVGAWPPRNLGLCRCPGFKVSIFHHTCLRMGVKMKKTIPCMCVKRQTCWYPFFVYHSTFESTKEPKTWSPTNLPASLRAWAGDVPDQVMHDITAFIKERQITAWDWMKGIWRGMCFYFPWFFPFSCLFLFLRYSLHILIIGLDIKVRTANNTSHPPPLRLPLPASKHLTRQGLSQAIASPFTLHEMTVEIHE